MEFSTWICIPFSGEEPYQNKITCVQYIYIYNSGNDVLKINVSRIVYNPLANNILCICTRVIFFCSWFMAYGHASHGESKRRENITPY